ncbi:MAG: exonuclease SbcCD subunit D [Christensenellales bacterium]|nr:exonuclease SbcCD subunit D [Christensenellales bacterium]
MKLFHLSDLHIGKRVNEVSMLEDQAHILAQILTLIDEERPDALLIAGDVYDKSIPPAEAVSLFDDFLYSVSRRGVPVLMISGNHDSPERLAFGRRMMEGAGVYISPVYAGETTPVTLHDAHGDVHFWLLPFLKPAHVRRFEPEAEIESYTDAVRVAIDRMNVDFSVRNVLLTHQFVTGAATCESEELSVGGTDNVDASVFDGFDYVALGHLHGPQNVGSSRVRYCGTPLKYSFSEEKQEKSVTVVHLGEKGTLRLEALALRPLHDMRRIRGSFAQLTAQGTAQNTQDYLHIVLTDEEDVPEAMGRLRQIYPQIMKLSYDNTRTRSDQIVEGAQDVQRKSPLALFEELYELMNNRPMSEAQRAFASAQIEAIWEEQA